MATEMEQPPIDVAKLVHDYMRSFAKCYKVPRHYDEEDELLKWCEQMGKQYRDWMYYKGHTKDPHCALNIKDPKWCTVFELRWAHLIIGNVDRSNK